MIGHRAIQRYGMSHVIGKCDGGAGCQRIFARLQLEGEEFLLTSPFIELTGSGKSIPAKSQMPFRWDRQCAEISEQVPELGSHSLLRLMKSLP